MASDSLPKLPRNAPRRPERPRYREQYGIILVCPDEEAQQLLYKALSAIGECQLKVVVT